MKYAFTILVMALFLSGCGQMIGNDPEGITGGHEGGYGSYGGSYFGDYDYYLFGNWQQNLTNGDINTVIFSADGTVKVNFQAGNSATGTFFVSGNRLDINVPGWKTGSEIITIDGDTLTLT
ncbi:MAG TPA: hypothetical protein DEO84_06105, partial [candidate division Zixibacteria bacterium]|nr:hypothetical protein [candidate division Zixibacteria bacterium]